MLEEIKLEFRIPLSETFSSTSLCHLCHPARLATVFSVTGQGQDTHVGTIGMGMLMTLLRLRRLCACKRSFTSVTVTRIYYLRR